MYSKVNLKQIILDNTLQIDFHNIGASSVVKQTGDEVVISNYVRFEIGFNGTVKTSVS